jgi:hypothetical protein
MKLKFSQLSHAQLLWNKLREPGFTSGNEAKPSQKLSQPTEKSNWN